MKSMLLMTLMVALCGTVCSADLLTQDELEALMISSAAESQTYRFSIDAVICQAADNDPDAPGENSSHLTGQGAVNLTGRSMVAVINATGTDTDSSQSMTVYAINDTMYVKQGGKWSKMSISSPDDLWSIQKIQSRQSDLADHIQVSQEGLDEISGDQCYRLRITPDLTTGAGVLADQMGPLASASFSKVNASDLFMEISRCSAVRDWNVWISRDSRLQRKTSIGADISITPKALRSLQMGLAGNRSINLTIDATIDYSDHNSMIDVALPEGAIEAASNLVEPGSTGEELTGSKSQPDQGQYPEITVIRVLDHAISTSPPRPGQDAAKSDIIYDQDLFAISWIKLDKTDDPHTIVWMWYAPDGSRYRSFQKQIPDPASYSSDDALFEWDGMGIMGSDVQNMPGRWRVAVYIDGLPEFTDGFVLATYGEKAGG